MPKGGDALKRFKELVAKQIARRSSPGGAVFAIANDELARIRLLAVQYFGTRANIFGEPNAPGIINVGFFYDDDKRIPPAQRPQRIVARGATYREIEEQIALWKGTI